MCNRDSTSQESSFARLMPQTVLVRPTCRNVNLHNHILSMVSMAQENKHLSRWRIHWFPSERGTLDSLAIASPEPLQASQTVATSQRYPSSSTTSLEGSPSDLQDAWPDGPWVELDKQLM